MKKLLIMTLALLTLGSQMEVAAQKKEKAKKEKKELKWEWDGKTLSGNKEIDNYIKTIDTLYTRVQTYKDSLDSYTLESKAFELNGKKYELAYMLNSEGQLVTRGQVNWQCVQAVLQGTNIVLDMTNAGLMSANAALTLPQLGLKALSFGKYVKGGPAVISQGTKAIKAVRKKWKKNARRWKEMKVDAIEDPKSLNFEGMTDELAKKLNKCCYIKEIKETSETKEEDKSEAQVIGDAKETFNIIAKAEQAKEDARKDAENMEGYDDLFGPSADDDDV